MEVDDINKEYSIDPYLSESLDFGFEVIQSNLTTSNESIGLPSNVNGGSLTTQEVTHFSGSDVSGKVCQTIPATQTNTSVDLIFDKHQEGESEHAKVNAPSAITSESLDLSDYTLPKQVNIDSLLTEKVEQMESNTLTHLSDTMTGLSDSKSIGQENDHESLKEAFDKLSRTCDGLQESNSSLTQQIDLISQKLDILPVFNDKLGGILDQELKTFEESSLQFLPYKNAETPLFQSTMDGASLMEMPVISVIQNRIGNLEKVLEQNKMMYNAQIQHMQELENSRRSEISSLHDQIRENAFVSECAVNAARKDEREHCIREFQNNLQQSSDQKMQKELKELKELNEKLLNDIHVKDAYIMDLEAINAALQG